MSPRITPIEKPTGFLRNIMYFIIKKEFGKVIMPAKVIYARYPKIGMLVKKLYDVELSLKIIPEPEKLLIQNLVATLNGCTFCIDISKRKSINKKINSDHFNNLLTDLPNFEQSNKYTEREHALFKYVKEMTENIEVNDTIYENLKKFCSDEEIIEITYIAVSENYLNRLIKPLNIGSDELCELR